MAERLPGTGVEKDRPIPPIPLVDARSGAMVDLSDLRHRTALALLFLHDRCEVCRTYAREMAARADDLRFADAQARAVLSEPADLAVPVLIDRGGAAGARLLGHDAELPVVLLLDRFGAPIGSFPAAGHAFPDADQVVASLLHERMQCPECGAPTW